MSDSERVRVRTYVPEFQKEAWNDHAEQLDMSQSEFVRTMVQAGRRGFDPGHGPDDRDTDTIAGSGTDNEATNSGNGSKPGGSDSGGLEARVRATLSSDQHLSWDELVEALTDDLEDRLEATLQELQSADEVRYSGRHGGYTLLEE